MIIAGIDIGTNTVLLLVADIDQDGTISVIDQQQRLPRLGKDVDGSGKIIHSELVSEVAHEPNYDAALSAIA